MSSNFVRFPAAQGHQLAGRLEIPAGTPRAYALFAHCFTCSKDSKGAAFVGHALAARGIAVLRFDFTGLGQSDGDFGDSNFSANIDDVVCAARFLEREHATPTILIGHSLGGAATLAAASALPQARAVATIGSPFEPRHVEHLITKKGDLLNNGEATVDIGGRPFRVRRDFIDDLARHDPSGTIGSLRKALLILHSLQDKIVSIDNAARIFTAARHPKSFVSLDRADHLLTQAEDATYAAEVIAAWASHYLEPVQVDAIPGVRVVEAGP